MSTTRYRGFTILAQPYLLQESQEWTADLAVQRHHRLRTFSMVERYQTEEEADRETAIIGRRIVDGRMPGRSIRQLRGRSAGTKTLDRYWRAIPAFRLIAGGVAAVAGGTLLLLLGRELVAAGFGQAAVVLGLGLVAAGAGRLVASSRRPRAAAHPTQPKSYWRAEDYLVTPRRARSRRPAQTERPILPHRHAR